MEVIQVIVQESLEVLAAEAEADLVLLVNQEVLVTHHPFLLLKDLQVVMAFRQVNLAVAVVVPLVAEEMLLEVQEAVEVVMEQLHQYLVHQ